MCRPVTEAPGSAANNLLPSLPSRHGKFPKSWSFSSSRESQLQLVLPTKSCSPLLARLQPLLLLTLGHLDQPHKLRKQKPPSHTPTSRDSIWAALAAMQLSLSNIDAWIQSLEALNPATPLGLASQMSAEVEHPVGGPSSRAVNVSTYPLNDVVPCRTLVRAVLFASGIPFFPPAPAISHNLRSQTLAGYNLNLIKNSAPLGFLARNVLWNVETLS